MTDNRVPAEVRVYGEQAQRQEQDADSAGRDVAAQLEDQLRRALADLDNLRKRYQRDLDRERAAERAGLAAAWLPVVDHLELALRHADEDATALVAGVRAVHEQAVATLARLGFPRLDAESPPGTVVSVIRPGYGTPEALLRPAGVVVARQ